MVRPSLRRSSQSIEKIEERSDDFVEDASQPTKSISGDPKSTPYETNKRKMKDAHGSAEKDSGQKRARRMDHPRASSSSQMDSIATVGRRAHSPPRDVDEEHEIIATKDQANKAASPTKAVIGQFVELNPLPDDLDTLPPLTNSERKELERYLEFSKTETWREDWMGNLCFADKEIFNPDGKSRERSKKPLFVWAEKGKISRKLLNNLVRYVYNLEKTPLQAKKILANADPKSVTSLQDAVRRISYDPIVLQYDGWTTVKSSEPVGASGGPYRIGERVFWQGFEGIVIAYVHDNDIGDLWKAMWLEELDTFDLEAEELEDAKRRFERKMKQKEQQLKQKEQNTTKNSVAIAATKHDSASERRSGKSASADFYVEGIEHGIILAVSYSRGARPGVFWPARVMHFSEVHGVGSQKRMSTKQKLDVVFLAPYWNQSASYSGRNKTESYTDSLQRHGNSIFSSGPLFEIESIDVSPESMQAYPYDPDRGLDMDELSTSFRFAGLPKAAFSRFVQSHRLAVALKTYSQKIMQSTAATEVDKATAALFEAHPLAGQTAQFPDAVLHLPFDFILSHLPQVANGNDVDFTEADKEPALQLGVILEAMKPPTCWGQGENVVLQFNQSSPDLKPLSKPFLSPPVALSLDLKSEDGTLSLDRFLSGLSCLAGVLSNQNDYLSNVLLQYLTEIIKKVPAGPDDVSSLSIEERKIRIKALVRLWVIAKVRILFLFECDEVIDI